MDGIHIPAGVLEQIGRSLALRGNFVADVTADPMTGLALLPASSWDIVGSADPTTWTYHATLAGPSMQHTVTRTSAEIIHARVNSLPESPWAGRQPNDWTPRRFGLTYTEPNVLLRTAASADVVSSFGIPAALFSGSDGSLVREGWRQFGVAVQAWGNIVSDELSLKLERTITLSFRELASIDIAARARAMGVMVTAGVSIEGALKEAGLGDES